MPTALTTARLRARPTGRPRLAVAAVAALASTAAVIAVAAPGGEDYVAPTRATPAPTIDARPLIDPRTAAERFHHRLDVDPGRSVQIDGRPAAELFHHRP